VLFSRLGNGNSRSEQNPWSFQETIETTWLFEEKTSNQLPSSKSYVQNHEETGQTGKEIYEAQW